MTCANVVFMILAMVFSVGRPVAGSGTEGLRFHASFDRGMDADHATGDGKHRFSGDVTSAEGMKGKGVLLYSVPEQDKARLSYTAVEHVDPARGTISFWLAPAWNTVVMRSPEIFKVDGLFTIYYEPYHPVVVVLVHRADGELRTFEIKRGLHQEQWVHLTMTWDCKEGVNVFLDGEPAGHFAGQWKPPVLRADARMAFVLTNDLGARAKVHALGGSVDEFRVFDHALSAEQVVRRFHGDGGQGGIEQTFHLDVDLGSTVHFKRLQWAPLDGMHLTVRSSSAPTVTWVALSWGGPEQWTRLKKVDHDGSLASPAGRHLRLTFTFKHPNRPERLPVTDLQLNFVHAHDLERTRTLSLDPARAKRPREAVSHIPITRDVVTPHEPWATPWKGGTTKALILTHLHNQREIVELAQRMELTFDTASVTKYAWLLSVASRHRTNLSWSNVLGKLEEDLKANRYDVIVIGGAPWKRLFDEAVRKGVLDQVKAGAGLVVILDPVDTTDDLAALLPLKQFVDSGEREDPNWRHSSFIGESRGRWDKSGDHFIVNGIPFGVLPVAPYFKYAQIEGSVIAHAGPDGDPLVALGTYGQGRVVQIAIGTAKGWGGNRALTPHVPYDTSFHYWEYYLSLVARSMLWAAHKEPDLSITMGTPNGEVFEAGAEKHVVLAMKNHGAERQVNVALTVRDEQWTTVSEQVRTVDCPARRSTTVTFSLPTSLAGGGYVADAVIREAGKSVNWGSGHFTVTPPVGIATCAFERQVYDPGETLRASVTLATGTDRREKVVLKARLWDTHDRLVAETTEPLAVYGQVTTTVAFAEIRSLTTYLKGMFEVWHDDALVSRHHAWCVMRQPWKWDDYRPVIWSDFATTGVVEYLRPHYLAKLKAMGFDAIEDDAHFLEDFRFYARHNMQPFPIGFGGSVFHGNVQEKYEATGDKRELVRHPCLHDPTFREGRRSAAAANLKGLNDLNPLGYILADETSLTAAGVPTYPTRGVDICFSSETLEVFRHWLEREYETLSSLNAQWESDFGSWEDVVPATKEELFERKTANYSAWSDHRTFMESAWHDTYAISVDTLRAASPRVPVGLSGTSPPATYTGFDYSRLGKLFDTHWMYYHGAAGEIWRSFQPHGSFLSCQGYGQSQLKRKAMLWDTLLNGHKGTLHWTMPIFINPDLTLSSHGEDLRQWHGELRSGIGRLLIEAERQSDPIAILYSQRSLQAAWITGAGKGDVAVARYESLYHTKMKDTWVSSNEVRHLGNMDTYGNLLEGAGLQYDFVTPTHLVDGDLQRREYRVLILPWTMALSDAEASAIRAFVEGGGLLIADVMPGIMDGHCRMRDRGALDEVFGVETAGYTSPKHPARVAWPAETFVELPLGRTLHNVLAGPAVSRAVAESLGVLSGDGVTGEAVFVNRHGDGRAILLNCLLSDQVDAATWANQAQMLAELIAWADLRPRLRIQGPDPFTPYYESVFYRQGQYLEYLGILRRLYGSDRDEHIAVTLNTAKHIYDVRRKKHLGLTDTIKTSIPHGEAAIFALFPYALQAISIEIASTVKAGDRMEVVVRVDAGDATVGDHVIRVEAYDPEGRFVAPYSGNFLARAGVLKQSIKLALNDRPGPWRFKAVDVVSGMASQDIVTLQHANDGG